MKASRVRSTVFTLVLLSASVAIMAASARVQVDTNRDVRLAVIDARTPAADREALHRTLAAKMSFTMSQRSGDAVRVRPVEVKPRDARSQLEAGGCDAVLVLDDDRPAVLRRGNAIALCGALDPETGRQQVYLILGVTDPALRDLLVGAFSALVADRVFLKKLQSGVAYADLVAAQ